MDHSNFVSKYLQGQGAEIGAFKTPIPGIKPCYIDKFDTFDGESCLVDYLGDAINLPFENASLDYIANSHVLEHVSNPVKALLEWQRVLKPGGVVYAVIPDRRFTFDHARELTPAEHMIEDYKKGTTDCDATHIKDFIYGIDWSHTHPDIPAEEVPGHQKHHYEYYVDQVAKGNEINLHFHVFEPNSFNDFINACTASRDVNLQLDIEELVESFPEPEVNGFLVVLRKRGRTGCISSLKTAFRKLANPDFPLIKGTPAVVKNRA